MSRWRSTTLASPAQGFAELGALTYLRARYRGGAASVRPQVHVLVSGRSPDLRAIGVASARPTVAVRNPVRRSPISPNVSATDWAPGRRRYFTITGSNSRRPGRPRHRLSHPGARQAVAAEHAQLRSLHGRSPPQLVQRPPHRDRRLTRAADALRAGDARGACCVHRLARTQRGLVEPLPRVDPVRPLAPDLRTREGGDAAPRAPSARGALAGLLPECAVPGDRPETRRAGRTSTAALRRVAVRELCVGRPAARPDLALPDPRRRPAADRCAERVGAGRRRTRAELLRHLPRACAPLELVGRRCTPRPARASDRVRSPGSAEPPAAARAHGAVHVVLAGELRRAVLVRAPEPRVGRARTLTLELANRTYVRLDQMGAARAGRSRPTRRDARRDGAALDGRGGSVAVRHELDLRGARRLAARRRHGRRQPRPLQRRDRLPHRRHT